MERTMDHAMHKSSLQLKSVQLLPSSRGLGLTVERQRHMYIGLTSMLSPIIPPSIFTDSSTSDVNPG